MDSPQSALGRVVKGEGELVQHPGKRRAPVSRFVAAALADDVRGATAVALEFMAEKNSRATVIADLFHGAQLQVADSWHVGLASAADEFRIFTAIERAAAALPRPADVPARRGSVILLATLGPEAHDLGVRLFAMALIDDGWNVDLVRQAEPVDLIVRADDVGAGLVGISSTFATRRTHLQLERAVRSVRARGLPVIVGGAAFVRAPGLAEQIGADAVAPEARFGVILARRLHVGARISRQAS